MTGADAPSSTPHQGLRDAVAERMAADRQEDDFPAERLEAIDAAVRRRTVRSSTAGLGDRLRALDAAADIDTAAPVASEHRGGRVVKVAISKATGWYVGRVAVQARDLGVATAKAFRALAARIDELDRRVDALEGGTATEEQR